MADGQARVGVQGTDNKEAEEERLERRLREIMGDTGVEGMADINLKQEAERSGQASSVRRRSARGATTTSPIQESDMVKHYKSLFFARNGAALKATQGGNRGVPPISTNGYTAPSETATNGVGPAQRLTSKYKTNIVPPHMKRPKAQSKSAISRKIHSSFMSSLPPEQIPSYFSAPALARMEPKAHSHETEKKEGEPQSQGETGAREGKSEEKSLGPEEEVVAKAELEQAKLELEEAKERLKLYQDQGERVKELESQIADLNETKLDAKGMSVSMQRQLTQLTGERQDMLLELRDLRHQAEDFQGMLQKKDELMKVMKQKTKLLEAKGMKLERELVETKAEIDAEREALSNTMQNQALKDAMLRIAELEALNHALRESIKQRTRS